MPTDPRIEFMRECRDCGKSVGFSHAVTNGVGMLTPLDIQTGCRHQCELSEEHLIERLNNHVEHFRRKLGSRYHVALIVTKKETLA